MRVGFFLVLTLILFGGFVLDNLDFYAPYTMPDGRKIYGAAAMNKRVREAGDLNLLANNLVKMGIRLGYEQAKRASQTR